MQEIESESLSLPTINFDGEEIKKNSLGFQSVLIYFLFFRFLIKNESYSVSDALKTLVVYIGD